jgi:glycerophosphoryl diester phosphodiesterase
MKVVEQFILGRYKVDTKTRCEDGVVITENFIAVIDGTSCKSGANYGGKTTGRIAMEYIKEAIEGFSKDIDCYDAINNVTEKISSFYHKNNIYDEARSDVRKRLTACAIIYSKARKEIWVVGDCQALIIRKDGYKQKIENPLMADEVTINTRVYITTAALASGKTVEELLTDDPGSKFIRPMINDIQIQFQNKPGYEYSFGVFDGFEIPHELVKVIPIEDDDREIVFASDGYFDLRSTLEESEQEVQIQKIVDPLFISRHKATSGITKAKAGEDKSKEKTWKDDRSYVRIQI